MSKTQFEIDDYEFKIVKMNVFDKNKNSITKLNYFLLIDENNFIHDYKIEFVDLNICSMTTYSHKETKKENYSLCLRKEILFKLKIEHCYRVNNEKKKYFEFDNEQIKKYDLNKWSFNQDWKNITFQNISYIIKGSNPSGEGKGKSNLVVLYKGEKYPFGFLLKTLNCSSEIKKTKKNVDYSLIWKRFENDELTIINFEKWMIDSNLHIYLKNFKYDSESWKEHKKNLEEYSKKNFKLFKQMDDLVSKFRNYYTKDLNKIYIRKNKDVYSEFFEVNNKNEINNKWIGAHIKPVWFIKKESNQLKNKKILEEIKDINNFLPLTSNIHDNYDNKYFYWDESGKLILLKKEFTSEINNFMQIKKDIVNKPEVKKYLKEYFQKIIVPLKK